MTQEPKPQLHPSDIHGILACGEKWMRKKILGETEPISTPLLLGRSQHKVAFEDMSNMLKTGSLLPDDALRDLASDTFHATWAEVPVLLDEYEQSIGVDAVKGNLLNIADDAAMLHHRELAPTLRPAPDGLEWPWVLESNGYPYDLAGTVDVKEHITFCDTKFARIRDLKVVKQKPIQHEIDQSGQWTAYSMAAEVIDGLPVLDVWLDALVKPTKTMGTRLFSLRSTRTDDDRRAFVARFEQAISAIEKGLFMPANPAEPWAPCGYCGFAKSCRYVAKKPTSISLVQVTPANKGVTHGPKSTKPAKSAKSIIKPGSDEWRDAIAR